MSEKLIAVNKKEYGSSYSRDYFDQYKLYIESAEKGRDRRQNTNNYFITINTALISLIGLSFQLKGTQDNKIIQILLSLIGILICLIFWFLIRSYRQLNSGKFKVIHEIEEKLPLRLYQYEWEILGEGRDDKLYAPFSHIEQYIPVIFGVIYVVIGLFFIY